jgi:predicted N-acetyltransferase YhbS
LPLFRRADDSEMAIESYLHQGEVLIARDQGMTIGHVQIVEVDKQNVELTSMAVVDARHRSGIGRALVDAAVTRCMARGAARIVVATAAASVGTLRFYQRVGFRMLRIERDAFCAEAGYPPGIVIDGIPLRDRVWLDRALR